MKAGVVAVLVLFACQAAFPKRPASHPLPTEFEIGRLTFFDFGPPFDYYEILTARSTKNGTSVERLLLTPAAGCFRPATLELASATMTESVAELFGGTNPCSIPEKALERELKQRKKYPAYSGAIVSMQVKCEGHERILRADILDRDMFDSAPNTPKHTSWTMELLSKLDQSLGPGVMQKPIFPDPNEISETRSGSLDSGALRRLEAGDYDALFDTARNKPSELYKATLIPPVQPSIRLVSSTPYSPRTFVSPTYPPIAKLARLEGKVEVHLKVANNGTITGFEYKSGHPMLHTATEEAVNKWIFPVAAAGQEIDAVLEFNTNCPKETK